MADVGGFLLGTTTVANSLSKILIEEYIVLGSSTARQVAWIERELRSLQGLLERVGHRRYGEKEQELNEWEEKLKEIASDAEDVIETFVIKSVKRRRWGVLYWIDKHKVGKELEKIRKRMRDISQTGMNLSTDIVGVSVETMPGGGGETTSSSTIVVVAMEMLDHVMSQTTLVTGEEVIEMVEQVKGDFVHLQNNIVSNLWSTSERENVWLEEVKELCNYTERVVSKFILVKERRSKMGRLKKILYLLADYASENEFKKKMKYIRTRIGDAVHKSLTYGVGGQLVNMGGGLKRTTPLPGLSQERLIIILILFLIVYAIIVLSDFNKASFWLLLVILIPLMIMVKKQGRTIKRKSKSGLNKKKKWKGREIIRQFLRFLFSTVMYLPISFLFQFHPVLALFLFILAYSLIDVIVWSLKKKKEWTGKEIIRRFLRLLFSTVIYLPILYLFRFIPVLATFLFILGYLLIEVIARSLKKMMKWNLREIGWFLLSFLFGLIYLLTMLIFPFPPVWATLFFILDYSLIEVIAWSVNLRRSMDNNLRSMQRFLSTVIDIPTFSMFWFHPILATFLLMLSYSLIDVIAWSGNLRRSIDKNLKCTQRYLALICVFLSDTTESAEGLNRRQRVWVGQVRVVYQNGQSLIDAYLKGKGDCLSRMKFAKDINRLLKEILDISDRKAIYGIANIETTQEPVPLLDIQESGIENEIIVEHDENSGSTQAAAASFSYRLVTGLKEKVQSIIGEKELMDALLLDAQEMGELDGRSRIWVEQLKGISLEAQSIIIKYDAQLKHKPILIYIFKYRTRSIVNKKIDGIRNKIEDAYRRRKAYGLVQIQSRVVPKVQILRARMQPSLTARESSVVGFDDDTQVLMAKLLSDEKHRCITWIVGIGGTGKTTLAKLIFEDNTVVAHFQRRLWVSLPSDCTTNQLIAEIGKEAAKQIAVEEGEILSTDYILETLVHAKYLVVVDGIKETSQVYLDTLNRVIPDMSTGSRVLFTTRNANVAQHAAGTVFVHPLQLLDDETSWRLFTRHFKANIPPESEKELLKVEKEIVMKCGGLPSQILKMSDLLSHRNVMHEEWLSMLGGQPFSEDQIQSWSETLDTINTNLPSYLRRCLFYFLQFPAEFAIPVRRLVVLWVAENLVHRTEDDEVPLELVAKKYLTELIDQNMVQVAKRKRNGKVKTCRLPSALRQLWLTKANESRFLQGHRSAMDSNADPKMSIIRRVADHLDKNDIWNDHIHGDITDPTSLPTYYKDVLSFISFDTQEGSKPGQQVGNFLKGCISSDCFLLLRVLDLERVYKPNLPNRIARLSRLRYLGLRWTYLESLPSSISKLLKLQTLDLKHTYIHTLPTSIWKMELRHLFLSETYRTKFPPQPKGNSLSDLQTLWGLFVDEESPVKDGLDRLVNITKLGLACQSMSLNQEAMIAQLEAVADWITTLEYLQSLRLKSRDEEGQPWILHLKSFEKNVNLTDMYLLGSLSSSSLLLSQFPLSLIDLTLSHSKLQDDPMKLLKDFPNLRTLCLLAESYTGTTMVCESQSFPRLQFLKLWVLEQLEEWTIEPGALPCLRQLEIRSCPRLILLPDGLKHVNTLLELKLTNMPMDIIVEVHNIPPKCQVIQTNFQ